LERVQFRDKSKPAPLRPPSTQTHFIIVSPAIGSTGKPLPGKWDAGLTETSASKSDAEKGKTLEGRLLVSQSRTPFRDAARCLLKDGTASEPDILIMRHLNASHDALKANIGIAAKLTVAEEPRLRFAKWTPPETRWRGQ
jgi:hypothetical protein